MINCKVVKLLLRYRHSLFVLKVPSNTNQPLICLRIRLFMLTTVNHYCTRSIALPVLDTFVCADVSYDSWFYLFIYFIYLFELDVSDQLL